MKQIKEKKKKKKVSEATIPLISSVDTFHVLFNEMGHVSVTQQQLELLEENEKLSNFPAVLSLETFGFSVILLAAYLGRRGGGGGEDGTQVYLCPGGQVRTLQPPRM